MHGEGTPHTLDQFEDGRTRNVQLLRDSAASEPLCSQSGDVAIVRIDSCGCPSLTPRFLAAAKPARMPSVAAARLNSSIASRAVLIKDFRKRAWCSSKGFGRGLVVAPSSRQSPMRRRPRWRNYGWRWRPRPIGAVTSGLAVMRSLIMGLERRVVRARFCRTDRVIRLWIEMFNTGGIDALTTKGRAGRGRRVKLERLRDLLVPVLENPARSRRASLDGSQNPWISQGAAWAGGGLQHHGALPP